MPPKRKTRNLPSVNDKESMNQMSFFDPVYQADSMEMNPTESDSEFSSTNRSRQSFRDQSNETLDAYPMTKTEQEPLGDISIEKITDRIKQIQYSLEQAQQMLKSMDQFKHLVPGTQEQVEKLRIIVANLEEQKAGYVNLLNLINLTNQERAELLDRISASQNQMSTAGDEEESDEDDVRSQNASSSRRTNQSPIRPRIESKIGFTPHPTIPPTPTVPPTINSSDNEQTNRHDNSNYDSLVGSLKSDTLNWKDQQLTSDDEVSDGEDEKEIERNLMLQKEQLRALQGQKRALLALKKRSEQRLLEQQQQLLKHKSTNEKENNLLGDINNLRDRLQLLRNLYEQKHQAEVQQIKTSSKKAVPTMATNDSRMKNLQHVRDQLDELEQIIDYYQTDLTQTQDEEQTIYEETPIQPDDVQRLKTLIMQQRQQQKPLPPPPPKAEIKEKPLDKLSSELATKRLELEQAKSALSRLQQMVKTIEPNENASSVRSTPTATPSKSKPSLLSSLLSTKSSTNTYTDAQMAAQHREIERLLESRQRLSTLKEQISSLHQTMMTPTTTQTNPSMTNYSTKTQIDDVIDDDDFYRSECDSGDGEEIDDEIDDKDTFFEESQSRIKQGNFRAPEDIVAENEGNLLIKRTPPPPSSSSNEELAGQMRDICRCLSTFIQEQKSFNRHIEEHLSAATRSQTSLQMTNQDPVFNQLQQQVLTQGLIVNLNTAYREIAVLQSEINGLQNENTRLTSSLSSFEQQHQKRPQSRSQIYSRNDSKDSIYSLNQIKPLRSHFDDQISSKNKFEASSKTSFSSQSTGKQTAIRCEKKSFETTPTKHSIERYASPKTIHLQSKENLSKSFVIRRRPMGEIDQPNLVQSQLFNYNQENISDEDNDDDDDDNDDDDEQQQIDDLSKTIFNIQPSMYSNSNTQDLDNVDIQTFDLQIKSIMIQLIPFMRLHINDTFNQSILNHIRERIIFLFKQQPDCVQLIRQYQSEFSQSLQKTIEKYCGTNIRDCANDLIRDISDAIFEELVKYKTQTNNIDDGENENKYQIELAESESRPLNLIGSDEEDNDSDQEEDKDSELETAVSRQESNIIPNENNSSSSSTELHSNGHEYVLVNRSSSQENEETKIDEQEQPNDNES